MCPAHSIQEYVYVVRDGVHKHYKAGGFKKRVIVVGAGLAGLSAAFELLKAGHEPLILEA
jgi:monoamine oxidase